MIDSLKLNHRWTQMNTDENLFYATLFLSAFIRVHLRLNNFRAFTCAKNEVSYSDMKNTIIPYPTVIEQTAKGERQFDIFSRLMMERIIFLGTPVDDGIANVIIAQLLFLQMNEPKKDIHFYINSPGGS